MQLTARSYLTAGVAAVGASAIALSPVAPPMPDVQVPAISSAAVELSAAVDPLQAWTSLFTNTAENVTTLGGQIFADPAPILTQVLKNQVARGETVATILDGVGKGTVEWATEMVPMFMDMAVKLAQEGKYDQAINTALALPAAGLLLGVGMPLIGLSSVTGGMTENLNNFMQAFGDTNTLFGTVLGALQTWASTTGALGTSVQNFADAVKAGDPLAVASAMIAAPALIANGVLNGGPYTPGLLTPDRPGIPGPIAGLMVQVRQKLAQAIGAPVPGSATTALSAEAPAALSALPKATANTLTVNLKTEAEDPAGDEATTGTGAGATGSDADINGAGSTDTDSAATGATSSDTAAQGPAAEVTDEAPNANTSNLVRTSPMAKPGQIGTAPKKAAGNLKKAADSFGKQVDSTVKKLTDGVKKGFAKPKPAKKDADAKGTGSSDAGSSDKAA